MDESTVRATRICYQNIIYSKHRLLQTIDNVWNIHTHCQRELKISRQPSVILLQTIITNDNSILFYKETVDLENCMKNSLSEQISKLDGTRNYAQLFSEWLFKSQGIWEQPSSQLLWSEKWQFLTDVSEQPISPIFKGTNTRCVINQKITALTDFMAEAWNHTYSVLDFGYLKKHKQNGSDAPPARCNKLQSEVL